MIVSPVKQAFKLIRGGRSPEYVICDASLNARFRAEARRPGSHFADMKKSIAQKSLMVTSLFETEVLVQLMLRNWGHPFANDHEFANALLESAAGALREAIHGAVLIEGVPPTDLNLIAAVWYAENCALNEEDFDTDETTARRNWLFAVRRALPSCFCDPSDLQQP